MPDPMQQIYYASGSADLSDIGHSRFDCIRRRIAREGLKPVKALDIRSI